MTPVPTPVSGAIVPMLPRTFLHLPGIGPVTEGALWARRVESWRMLRESDHVRRLPADRQRVLEREIERSEAALSAGDPDFFSRRLPTSEHWRLFPSFEAHIAYLDIETTGLSPYEGIVTVVTVHGRGATRTFVADDNLEELPAYLGRFQVLATFNGSLFDVPFLHVRFPDLPVPEGHIDLRFLLRRLGLVGGLKRIEQVLGLGDRDGVEGIHGLDAVRLWEAHRRGTSGALERLVRYNRADTVNLEPLLHYAVAEVARRTLAHPYR